jgi:hypothetical protein
MTMIIRQIISNNNARLRKQNMKVSSLRDIVNNLTDYDANLNFFSICLSERLRTPNLFIII